MGYGQACDFLGLVFSESKLRQQQSLTGSVCLQAILSLWELFWPQVLFHDISSGHG